ncbi:ATP synthase [cyanobiont of Ornithocercus magnificus]|nr:ATP synthase [cyanobiont of Ornithocercus magnificus]
MEDYARLQRRLMLATLAISLVTALVTLLWFGPRVACSLLLGSLAGLVYLRLLARSVARLGSGSYQIGRFQLAIPVMLIVAAARLPQLSILPAFLGFLLYKPALIIQAIIDA